MKWDVARFRQPPHRHVESADFKACRLREVNGPEVLKHLIADVAGGQDVQTTVASGGPSGALASQPVMRDPSHAVKVVLLPGSADCRTSWTWLRRVGPAPPMRPGPRSKPSTQARRLRSGSSFVRSASPAFSAAARPLTTAK